MDTFALTYDERTTILNSLLDVALMLPDDLESQFKRTFDVVNGVTHPQTDTVEYMLAERHINVMLFALVCVRPLGESKRINEILWKMGVDDADVRVVHLHEGPSTLQ